MKPFFVHLFHILFVGSLFLYVGIQRTNIPKFFYPILLGLAVVIFFYHGYKTYLKLSSGKNPWINLIHMFIIAPILLIIGLNKETTPRFYFEILMMLGFASIGYHGYYMIDETFSQQPPPKK